MNKRVERLCMLCCEVEKAYRQDGVIMFDGMARDVHLTSEAFFRYFDKYDKDETFIQKYTKFYRDYNGVHFFCLVEKEGDVKDE